MSQQSPRFHAVFFDFGGTVDADGEPSVAQFLKGYQAAGGARSPVEFEDIFRESDRRLATHPGIDTLGFRATVEAQSRLIAELVSDGESVDAAKIASSVQSRALPIAERNAGILRALQAHGMRTGVISNFTGNLVHCLAEIGLSGVLDVVIDSGVVGIRKPDEGIFKLALDALGVAPADALMVGDNPFADIGPPTVLGMATCWLAPLSRPAPEGCVPTFRIASLGDLLECLDAQRQTPSAQGQACTA